MSSSRRHQPLEQARRGLGQPDRSLFHGVVRLRRQGARELERLLVHQPLARLVGLGGDHDRRLRVVEHDQIGVFH